MSAVTFRIATAADLTAIVWLLYDDEKGRLREDPSEPLAPSYIAAFEAIDADPNEELVVAEQDGRIVGTLQLTYLINISFKGSWRGQIESVRIAKELRGQGMGAKLIDWAVERCRARNCLMVQLTSILDRTDAHRFYEKLGWAKSHAGFKLYLT